MDLLGSWGTDIELLCFAHLTNTCVFTYITVQSNWERFGQHNVDRNLRVNVNAHSVYLCLKNEHYGPTVVDLTENDPKPKESDIAKPDTGSKDNSKPKEHSDSAVAQAAFAARVAAEKSC